MKKHRGARRVLIALGILLLALVLAVGGYVGYMQWQYYRCLLYTSRLHRFPGAAGRMVRHRIRRSCPPSKFP